MFIKLSVVVALAALINAAPAPVKHVVHEERSIASRDWTKGARIEKSAVIPMRIGLAQTNLEKGYDYLMEVSHPDSENFGKHWTPEEVHNMFAPEAETVANIIEWLTNFGISSSRIVHSENKGWIAADVTVEEAEDLLRTEFHEHEHKNSPKVRVGCDKYHVPEHLAPHIDYITPGIKLTPVVKRTMKNKRATNFLAKAPLRTPGNAVKTVTSTDATVPAALVNCSTAMTPACIKALYSIPDATLATPGNSLGLYQQGSYFSESDVDLFFASFAPYIPQGTFPINASIDGGSYSVPAASDLNSGEADIDIEMTTSLIYPQTVTLYQTDDDIYEPAEVATTNVFNTFLDALDGSYCTYSAFGETGDEAPYDAVYPDPAEGGYKGQLECGIYTPTNVISASYGQAEIDLPAPYVQRQCNEFMKLGLQGHTIMFASGDYGVASFPGDGSDAGCLGPDAQIFNPQYPSGCPYVTSVGGSQLNGTVYDPETVMQDNLGGSAVNFSSAGGFSNYFPRPTYQDGHVETYFHRAHLTYPYYSELNVDLNTTTGIYNRIGRGYPDVSANGAHFPAYIDGELYHFYGSSLASPLFASVITLINEQRAVAGKGPVGFINPTLYRNDDALTDIVTGTNLGCGTEGFKAVEGWDPATGLGTPNYPKLLALFMSLP